MRRLFVSILTVLLTLLPGSTIAYTQGSLESRIQAVTGIVRTVDPALQARAAVRAVQIQTVWGHCCLSEGEGEIIAWNRGYADPVGQAIIDWTNSPSHAVIMYDPGYRRIGCAGTTQVSTGRFYAVCLFYTGIGQPIVNEIPDTAMEQPE